MPPVVASPGTDGASAAARQSSAGAPRSKELPRLGEVNGDDAAFGWLVDVAIAEVATRAERVNAWVRGAFCLLLLTVYFLQHEALISRAQAIFEVFVTGFALAFSTWVWLRSRQRLLTRNTLLFSVFVDGMICTLGLLTNHFAPPGENLGLTASLDVAVAPLIVLASTLRLSRLAVLVSALTVSLGLALVLTLDQRAGIASDPHKLALLGVYVVFSALLAWLTTHWVLKTLHAASATTVRAERARGSLFALLSDHHDLRSIVCDLQINSERLQGSLASGDDTRAALDFSARVSQSITRLASATSHIRDRALSVLDASSFVQATDVEKAAHQAINAAQRLYPEFKLELSPSAELPRVLFGGGTEGLARILQTLVTNAFEGNSRGAACSVRINVERSGRGLLRLTVDDNGPGFPDELFQHLGQRGFTTKPGSSGLGLWLAHSAVTSAGGTLRLVTMPGGARVELLFRTLPPFAVLTRR